MSDTDDWHRKMADRHASEVAAGQHDEQCEYGPRMLRNLKGELQPSTLFMCHCAKRRRVAAGRTHPPGPLEHQYPLCPRCRYEVSHDGNGYVCETCSVSWSDDNPNDGGTFTDDYGDLGEPITPDPLPTTNPWLAADGPIRATLRGGGA